jgi:hypothetical protein
MNEDHLYVIFSALQLVTICEALRIYLFLLSERSCPLDLHASRSILSRNVLKNRVKKYERIVHVIRVKFKAN